MSEEPVAQAATTTTHYAAGGLPITREHVTYPAAISYAHRVSKYAGVKQIEVRLDGVLKAVYAWGQVLKRKDE